MSKLPFKVLHHQTKNEITFEVVHSVKSFLYIEISSFLESSEIINRKWLKTFNTKDRLNCNDGIIFDKFM